MSNEAINNETKNQQEKDFYSACNLCPRKCGSNRYQNKYGFCKEPSIIRAGTACLHFGEEPPITVNNGSGTIFITGCNLRCAFCQNYQISQKGMGAALSTNEFAEVCLRLQNLGAENINIVTGSHAIPAITEGLKEAKSKGLSIPVCWNTSSYETIEMLELLKEVVDIWLPDLKTLNPLISEAVFKAPDYPSVAKKAIRWMIENTEARFIEAPNEKEKMLSGVIIRHLVLPGRLNDTKQVLDWLKKVGDRDDAHKACISLMSQYTPVSVTESLFTETELNERTNALSAFENRLISKKEFAKITDLISEYDFSYLFYQELVEDTEWLPDFTCKQPFSYKLAKPVWHWKEGFIQ